MGLEKLIKLRNRLLQMVECKVGIGPLARSGHPAGVVIHRFPRAPTLSGLLLDSPLVPLIQEGEWEWLASRAVEGSKIIERLLEIQEGRDHIAWKGPFKIARNKLRNMIVP
ncbi:UNVERIFIED_CONTAM: hypothetical protein Sindi_0171900 [Sesamum indicum]